MDFIFISKVPPVAPYTSPVREKWPSFGQPFRPFKDVNTKQESPEVETAEPVGAASPAPVTNACSEVVVESIDPRKIPLLHYVNAELLPDAPKDDDDVSTEACYKRQARTIHGLLSDLRQRTEDLTQERTSHEITKSKLAGAEKTIQAKKRQITLLSSYISALSDERDSYKSQVLKNTESIAVVKYSQRDHEWHLVQNGIAWRALYSNPFNTLAQIANSINLGKNSVESFGLTRKPYYYKGDYA